MNENIEKTIFSDGEYVVWSNEEIQVGDTVELTTAEFDFDAVEGRFQKNLQRCFSVEVEILEEDLSQYVWEKSNNGGCYGFATAKVLSVEEVIE